MIGRNVSRGGAPGRRARVHRGFTLIELLLVLAILAVLAVVVVPKFTGRSKQEALDFFKLDIGRYPTTEESLGALVQQPSDLPEWRGPYLKRGMPKDPWQNLYVYRYPGQHNAGGYDLYSLGPDGQEGGGDDIDNWSQR